MIGIIRVSDIPRFVISIAIGAGLIFSMVAIFEHLHAHGTLAALLFVVGLVGIFSFSAWAGERIWEWIQSRF